MLHLCLLLWGFVIFPQCPISEVFQALEGVKKARLRAWQAKLPAPQTQLQV